MHEIYNPPTFQPDPLYDKASTFITYDYSQKKAPLIEINGALSKTICLPDLVIQA